METGKFFQRTADSFFLGSTLIFGAVPGMPSAMPLRRRSLQLRPPKPVYPAVFSLMRALEYLKTTISTLGTLNPRGLGHTR